MKKKKEKPTEETSFIDNLDVDGILALGDDIETFMEIAKSVRGEVRRKRKRALTSPDAYWVHEKPKKNPSRIKISLSRPLSDSEKHYFRDKFGKTGWVDDEGTIKSMFSEWQPHTGTFRCDFRDFRVRLSKNEQIYAESTTLGSVRLYDGVVALLTDYFVNLHPTAVRTLREIG